jgi:hypothetical protein
MCPATTQTSVVSGETIIQRSALSKANVRDGASRHLRPPPKSYILFTPQIAREFTLCTESRIFCFKRYRWRGIHKRILHFFQKLTKEISHLTRVHRQQRRLSKYLVLTAGPAGQFPRWRCSSRRGFLCAQLDVSMSVSFRNRCITLIRTCYTPTHIHSVVQSCMLIYLHIPLAYPVGGFGKFNPPPPKIPKF